MKTLKKRSEKKIVKGFRILEIKDLLQIRGGEGTIKDVVL